MLFTPGTAQLVASKIAICTTIYGVRVNLYEPISDLGSALQNYGDLQYSSTPNFVGKLLAPKLLVKRKFNAFSNLGFYDQEGEVLAYSTSLYPKYSKVVLTEQEYASFIISDIKETEDVQIGPIYYIYTIVPSSEFLNRPELATEQAEVTASESGNSSIDSVANTIEQSTVPASTSIKYNRL